MVVPGAFFFNALHRKNNQRPPVWLMRQAGRYLPSYQALRKKYSLYNMFFTPELAAQITLLPVEEIGVDAAILFSDITVLAKAFGLSLDFQEGIGPVIHPLIREARQLASFSLESLSPIAETIRILRKQLTVPLIGFCGGPFTVAHYLAYDQRDSHLLDRLTEVSCAYLDLQIDAGVHAIQIFDSWAHLLSPQDLHIFCLPYHERLIRHVQSRNIPVISFLRSSTSYPKEVAAMKPDAISFDWQRSLASMRALVGHEVALQGNLDPDLLFAPLATIEKETRELLTSMHSDPAFIVNLGHGIKPGTPWQAVKRLVELVKDITS